MAKGTAAVESLAKLASSTERSVATSCALKIVPLARHRTSRTLSNGKLGSRLTRRTEIVKHCLIGRVTSLVDEVTPCLGASGLPNEAIHLIENFIKSSPIHVMVLRRFSICGSSIYGWIQCPISEIAAHSNVTAFPVTTPAAPAPPVYLIAVFTNCKSGGPVAHIPI
ncbi:hypothetical protein EVAR_65550_1 [Eumeta japonica]|uniref:Uncharacterized protein n=1 Tax=Eumeta variegata TaxID=151549 RepID=A0A4C1ZWA1_EUMVA|nr:hypothetical protein EVAR_65550_1 [Eumeta japonica]